MVKIIIIIIQDNYTQHCTLPFTRNTTTPTLYTGCTLAQCIPAITISI